MRKNLFALAIAGILAVSTMAPTMVSAATTTPTPQEYQTPVSYKYKDPSLTFDGFTVTVPAALNLTSEKDTITDKVTVTMDQNRNIDAANAIFVSVKSKNGYKLNKKGSVLDETNDPVYELRALKEGAGGNIGDQTAFTGKDTYQEVTQFINTDFGDTSTEAVPKYADLQAKITKKPQVGLDNQVFEDTLTFKVEVKAKTI